MQSGFEWVAGWESKDGLGRSIPILSYCKDAVNFPISIAVPVESCPCGIARFRNMTFVKEVKRTPESELVHSPMT